MSPHCFPLYTISISWKEQSASVFFVKVVHFTAIRSKLLIIFNAADRSLELAHDICGKK